MLPTKLKKKHCICQKTSKIRPFVGLTHNFRSKNFVEGRSYGKEFKLNKHCILATTGQNKIYWKQIKATFLIIQFAAPKTHQSLQTVSSFAFVRKIQYW